MQQNSMLNNQELFWKWNYCIICNFNTRARVRVCVWTCIYVYIYSRLSCSNTTKCVVWVCIYEKAKENIFFRIYSVISFNFRLFRLLQLLPDSLTGYKSSSSLHWLSTSGSLYNFKLIPSGIFFMINCLVIIHRTLLSISY